MSFESAVQAILVGRRAHRADLYTRSGILAAKVRKSNEPLKLSYSVVGADGEFGDLFDSKPPCIPFAENILLGSRGLKKGMLDT